MEPQETVTVSITEFIQQLSKDLNISGLRGLSGNELELISLVRNCQFLYDKNVTGFKNIRKKNKAWEAIGDVFGVSVGEVQSKWKSLRDMFSRCKNNNDKSVITKTVCPFYNDLRFLEPYIIARRRKSGLQLSLTEVDCEDSITDQKASFSDLKQFISHIRNFPILYDHKYAGNSNASQKIECWIEIAKTFGVPVKDCWGRWRTLRERYSRERRSLQNNPQKWEFYQDLSFLDEHIKSRKRITDQRRVPTTTDQNIYVVMSPSPSATLDSTSFINESSSEPKKDTRMSDVEFFERIASPTTILNEESQSGMNRLDRIPNCENSITDRSIDEDELFGQTITAELKKVPCPRKKMKVKAEIYRILYEHTE